MTKKTKELNDDALKEVSGGYGGPLPRDGITFSEYDDIKPGFFYTTAPVDTSTEPPINLFDCAYVYINVQGFDDIWYGSTHITIFSRYFLGSESGETERMHNAEFKSKYRYVLNISNGRIIG